MALIETDLLGASLGVFEKKPVVYRFVDAVTGETYYIGNTTNIRQRIKQHNFVFNRPIKVQVFESSYEDRYADEAATIEWYKDEPLLNRRKPRNWEWESEPQFTDYCTIGYRQTDR